MNGAEALLRTLVANGVEVCFANPGTSEMHFVAALDAVPQMRAVLGLFEGVATGAADGHARMTGGPGATLLHLGPGLGNGLANLHNARRGGVPVVAIVGDHATWHRGRGAPLDSDIATVARNVSTWVRTTASPGDVGPDVTAAVTAAMGPPGQVATLIVPADVSWGDGAAPGTPRGARSLPPVDDDRVIATARALRSGTPAAVLVGGSVPADPAARAAARRVAAATGARVLAEVFPTRQVRGAGIAPLERLAYFPEQALAQLDGVAHLILVEASEPVSFFAYPEHDGRLVGDDCAVHTLAAVGGDGPAALAALADVLGVDDVPAGADARRPDLPSGPLDAVAVAAAVGAELPEGAVVSDEALTGSAPLPAATAGAPPHDWLTITGGAIGQGLPVATGAAVACPDRPVLALQADGSAMYTIQALWSQAREGLDVTTVIYDNAAYDILAIELGRVGAGRGGPRARALFDLTGPRLDFVALAAGMGVPAARVDTADDLVVALRRAFATPGPSLIDAVVPRLG
jgi:acetolactate synthase-1/2/3 large subunit